MTADNEVGPEWAFYGRRTQDESPRPAVFLDRDGVINRNRSDYVKSWDEFVFLPGALGAIARLAKTPYYVIVLTNQSVIGRGIVAAEVVKDIHQRMVDSVRRGGGRIDAVFWCPHRPEDQCGCRKPEPGMFREAANRFPLNLAESFFIGDAQSDVLAAQAAGCHPVLVLSGRIAPEKLLRWSPRLNGVTIQENLSAAVTWVLRGA